MKKFFRNLIQFLLISYVILGLFDGIVLPTNPLYLFATLLVLSTGMLMVSVILKFLTIKENFLTTLVMSFLIVLGFFFLLDFFMTGFYIEDSTFNGFELGNLIFNSMEMTPTVTMIVASICTSFLVSTLSVLEKSS